MNTEAAKVLAGARDVLAERGWFQGGFCADFIDGLGPVCAWGAVNVASSGDPYLATHKDAYRVLESVVFADGFCSIPEWNDDPQTTAEDVSLALKRAEELALTEASS